MRTIALLPEPIERLRPGRNGARHARTERLSGLPAHSNADGDDQVQSNPDHFDLFASSVRARRPFWQERCRARCSALFASRSPNKRRSPRGSGRAVQR